MNLFSSFAANSSLWLIWYLVVVPNSELVQLSPVSRLNETQSPVSEIEFSICLPSSSSFFSVFVSGLLCGFAHNTALFSADELFVDAVRGLLPAHGASRRFYIREKAGQMADSLRLVFAGHCHLHLWTGTRTQWQQRGESTVSAMQHDVSMCVCMCMCVWLAKLIVCTRTCKPICKLKSNQINCKPARLQFIRWQFAHRLSSSPSLSLSLSRARLSFQLLDDGHRL